MKRFRITWTYRSEHVFTIQDILCFDELEAIYLNISPSQYAIDKTIEEKCVREMRDGKWTIEHIEELI